MKKKCIKEELCVGLNKNDLFFTQCSICNSKINNIEQIMFFTSLNIDEG